MRLLAIDSATSGCSAALWGEGRLLARRAEAMERGHAERLVPMAAEVMAEADLGFDDLDLLAVTVGPGAFTGVRIGLAAARAMALAAGLPLVGLTTLEVVAAAYSGLAAPVLVALESKRTDLYVQLFRADGTPETPPQAVLPAAVEALLPPGRVALAGDARETVLTALATLAVAPGRLLLPDGPQRPDAGDLARLAAQRWAGGPPPADAPVPRPLYLRPPDARLPSAVP